MILFEARSANQGRMIIIVAGIIWSLGGPVIRIVELATEWQFLFYRSLGVVLTLSVLIQIKNKNLFVSLKKAGIAGVLGGD